MKPGLGKLTTRHPTEDHDRLPQRRLRAIGLWRSVISDAANVKHICRRGVLTHIEMFVNVARHMGLTFNREQEVAQRVEDDRASVDLDRSETMGTMSNDDMRPAVDELPRRRLEERGRLVGAPTVVRTLMAMHADDHVIGLASCFMDPSVHRGKVLFDHALLDQGLRASLEERGLEEDRTFGPLSDVEIAVWIRKQPRSLLRAGRGTGDTECGHDLIQRLEANVIETVRGGETQGIYPRTSHVIASRIRRSGGPRVA